MNEWKALLAGMEFPGETLGDRWVLADLVLQPTVAGGDPDVDMQPSITLDSERAWGPVFCRRAWGHRARHVYDCTGTLWDMRKHMC